MPGQGSTSLTQEADLHVPVPGHSSTLPGDVSHTGRDHTWKTQRRPLTPHLKPLALSQVCPTHLHFLTQHLTDQFFFGSEASPDRVTLPTLLGQTDLREDLLTNGGVSRQPISLLVPQTRSPDSPSLCLATSLADLGVEHGSDLSSLFHTLPRRPGSNLLCQLYCTHP